MKYHDKVQLRTLEAQNVDKLKAQPKKKKFTKEELLKLTLKDIAKS